MTEKKIWIVPCSGIGKSNCSVTRESAFILTADLCPGKTAIMALSRLVPEDSDVRTDLRNYPTIAIDGCKLSCAAKVVNETGGRVVHAVQVLDVYRANRELKPSGIAELDENGKKLAAVLAGEVATLIDSMMEKPDA